MKIKLSNSEIEVKQDGNKIIIGKLTFETIEDFILFVNKISDIAEKLLENNNEKIKFNNSSCIVSSIFIY